MRAAGKCPVCGMPVAEGDRFCGSCGAPLDAVPAGGAAPGAPPTALAVTCCAPRAMRVDVRSSFCFRLESSRDELAGASFVLKAGQTVLGSSPVTVPCGEWRMNITPSTPGRVFLELELHAEYASRGGTEIYRANFDMNVEPKLETAQTVVNHIHNEINGSVVRNQENGSIFSMSGLSAPASAGSGDLARYACDLSNPRPLVLALAKSPDALTLASETSEIVLVHKDCATVGRAPSSDFALPVFDGCAKRDDYLSRHVSGTHFRIGLCNGRCFVSDGGDNRPSTNGTAIDGSRLAPGGSGELSTGRSHRIAAMAAPAGGEELVPMTAAVCGDGWTQKPSGLVLRREDGVRSSLAVVWGSAGARLGEGVAVGWDGARFCVAGGGARRPLAIGDEIVVDGAAYRAMPSHQRFPVEHNTGNTTERNDIR